MRSGHWLGLVLLCARVPIYKKYRSLPVPSILLTDCVVLDKIHAECSEVDPRF